MKKLSLVTAVIIAISCTTYPAFAEEATVDEALIEISYDSAIENTEEITEEEVFEKTEESEENSMNLNSVDFAVLDETANAITAEMLTSGNEPAHMVTRNLDMSLAGDIVIPDGITVTFKSSDTSVIKDDGSVERSFEEDKTVTNYMNGKDLGALRDGKYEITNDDMRVLLIRQRRNVQDIIIVKYN